MGSALIKGFLASQLVAPEEIFVSSKNGSSALALAQEFGVHAAASNHEAITAASVIFLCTKPAQALEVLLENASVLKNKLIISVAAGLTCDALFKATGQHTRIIRSMPNTAVRLRKGVTSVTLHSSATEEDLVLAKKLFASVGTVVQVEEKEKNAVTAVSGSGPAFALLFLEALMDGGVAAGLDPALARTLAAHALGAAAALVLETEDSPATLRAEIASPKGTTEAGLNILHEKSLPAAVQAAVEAAIQRAEELARGV